MALMMNTSCIDGLTGITSYMGELIEMVRLTTGAHMKMCEIPELNSQIISSDKEVSEAVYNLGTSMNATMSRVQALVQKANDLAVFITNSRARALEAVDKGDANHLRFYLRSILTNTRCCESDIMTLRCLVTGNKKATIKLKDIVNERKENAGWVRRVTTGVAVAGGTVGTGGTAAAAGIGIAALIVSVAPVALLITVPVGIFAAFAGTTTAVAGGYKAVAAWYKEDQYSQALDSLQIVETKIKIIGDNLRDLTVQLDSTINNKSALEEQFKKEKLEKIAGNKKSGPIQRSMRDTIEQVTSEIHKVKEFTSPLKAAANLDDFIMKAKSA